MKTNVLKSDASDKQLAEIQKNHFITFLFILHDRNIQFNGKNVSETLSKKIYVCRKSLETYFTFYT